MRLNFLLALYVLLLLFTSCQHDTSFSSKNTHWVKSAHFYEIPLQHLSHDAPLKYLSHKLLPHLTAIGATAMVLPPMMDRLPLERDTSGKYLYPICDMRALLPPYGTMDSLYHFIQKAHKNTLKVLMEVPLDYIGNCDKSLQGTLLTPHTLKRDMNDKKAFSQLVKVLLAWAKKTDLDGFVLQGWQKVPESIRQSIYQTFSEKGLALIADSDGGTYPSPLTADGYLNYALYDALRAVATGLQKVNILDSYILDTAAHPVSIGFTSTLAINRKEGTFTRRFQRAGKSLTEFVLHTQRASWLLAGQELPMTSAYTPGRTIQQNQNWYRGAYQDDFRSVWKAPDANPALRFLPNTRNRIIDVGNDRIIAFEKKWKGYRWVGIFNLSDSLQVMVPTENIMNINAYPLETSIAMHKSDSFKLSRWQNLLLTKH